MNNQSVQCSQCGGNNTKRRYISTFLFLLGLNALLWIPVIGWLIGTSLIILGIYKISKKNKTFYCKDCKNLFQEINRTETFNHINIEEDVIYSTDPNNDLNNSSVPFKKNDEADSVSIIFNVAGVTYENDSGKEIQPLLRKIARQIAKDNDIESYGGYTNSEIIEYIESISEFEDVECGEYITFEKDPNNEFDKNAIKVIVELDSKKHHIGHVPKKNNLEIGSLLDSDSIVGISANFVGGKIKEVQYDFEKEKDIVVTNELTLGLEVILHIEQEQLKEVN